MPLCVSTVISSYIFSIIPVLTGVSVCRATIRPPASTSETEAGFGSFWRVFQHKDKCAVVCPVPGCLSVFWTLCICLGHQVLSMSFVFRDSSSGGGGEHADWTQEGLTGYWPHLSTGSFFTIRLSLADSHQVSSNSDYIFFFCLFPTHFSFLHPVPPTLHLSPSSLLLWLSSPSRWL